MLTLFGLKMDCATMGEVPIPGCLFTSYCSQYQGHNFLKVFIISPIFKSFCRKGNLFFRSTRFPNKPHVLSLMSTQTLRPASETPQKNPAFYLSIHPHIWLNRSIPRSCVFPYLSPSFPSICPASQLAAFVRFSRLDLGDEICR